MDNQAATKTWRWKLLQFHGSPRPPYFGSYSLKSSVVKGRRPFAKDEVVIESYEYDSSLEWEEPEEGEDLTDEEEEELMVEEEEEEDEGFVVDDGGEDSTSLTSLTEPELALNNLVIRSQNNARMLTYKGPLLDCLSMIVNVSDSSITPVARKEDPNNSKNASKEKDKAEKPISPPKKSKTPKKSKPNTTPNNKPKFKTLDLLWKVKS